MSTFAVLLGGLLGAVLRLRTEQLAPWRGWPLAVGVGGAFLLGMLTGAVLVDTTDPNGARTTLGIGLSAALLTYCVASSTLVTTLTKPNSGRAVLTVGLHFLAALAAATLGVTAGVLFLTTTG